MGSILKEVRVRGYGQDRDIKVTIEKSGLFNKKRKVYTTFWGKNNSEYESDKSLYDWGEMEFVLEDLTEDKNFGEYQTYYESYIAARDKPNPFKISNFYQVNNLEFSKDWNTDLDIIKLYILINTEKTKPKVVYWSLIEDPIKGEKGGIAPYYRSFGTDAYYLNNGAEIYISWSEGTLSKGGDSWSDEKGKELKEQDLTKYNTKYLTKDTKINIDKMVSRVVAPEGNSVGDVTITYDPRSTPVFSKEFKSSQKVFATVDDIDIVDQVVSHWKQAVPGYESLEVLKNSYGNPIVKKSDLSTVLIEYKSPLGLSASEPTGMTPSGMTPSNTGLSGSNTGLSASEPTTFKPTIKGIEDGFQISAKTDLPTFSIYVGDPDKDWPKVGAGDLPEGGEDFENVDGASQEGLDEEYTEGSFEGAEEVELQFNPGVPIGAGDESDDSGSYLDKGGAGSEQIGPIEPGLPANEAQKESAKKSRIASGCMVKGGGACGRYTWNLAKNYHRFLKGLTGLPQREAAGGNAKQPAYYNRLVSELKYKQIVDKSSITKDDLIKSLRDTKWGIGDVVSYWSNTNGGESHQIYGHTQMYVGAISAGGWASDQIDNFSCSMVYKGKKDNDWGYVAFRSPDTPSKS